MDLDDLNFNGQEIEELLAGIPHMALPKVELSEEARQAFNEAVEQTVRLAANFVMVTDATVEEKVDLMAKLCQLRPI